MPRKKTPETAPWPKVFRSTRRTTEVVFRSFDVLGRCWFIVPLIFVLSTLQAAVQTANAMLPKDLQLLIVCVGIAVGIVVLGFEFQFIQHLIMQAADQARRRRRFSEAFRFAAATILRGASAVVVTFAPTGFALVFLALAALLGRALTGIGSVVLAASIVVQLLWIPIASFVPAIVAAEPCGAWEALLKSRRLAYHGWGPLLLLGAVCVFVSLAIELVFRGVAGLPSARPATSIAAATLTIMVQSVLGGYVMVYLTVYYVSAGRPRSKSSMS